MKTFDEENILELNDAACLAVGQVIHLLLADDHDIYAVKRAAFSGSTGPERLGFHKLFYK